VEDEFVRFREIKGKENQTVLFIFNKSVRGIQIGKQVSGNSK
jgi:hypothetical protein